MGAQYYFFMETHTTLVVPTENGLTVYATTQGATSVQVSLFLTLLLRPIVYYIRIDILLLLLFCIPLINIFLASFCASISGCGVWSYQPLSEQCERHSRKCRRRIWRKGSSLSPHACCWYFSLPPLFLSFTFPIALVSLLPPLRSIFFTPRHLSSPTLFSRHCIASCKAPHQDADDVAGLHAICWSQASYACRLPNRVHEQRPSSGATSYVVHGLWIHSWR